MLFPDRKNIYLLAENRFLRKNFDFCLKKANTKGKQKQKNDQFDDLVIIFGFLPDVKE